MQQLHLPFLDMEFDEIRSKVQEMAGQRVCLGHNMIAATRLLELDGRVPGARTPRAALCKMRVGVEEWMAGALFP